MALKYLLTCALLMAIGGARAQSAQDSVRTAVNQLFTAMKNADSAQLVAAFDDSAVLQTIVVDSAGKVSARSYPVTQFASAISRLPKGAADEQIHIETLKIDGPLAAVWASYHFYYNGTLLHCGVDSFQLVRVNGVWKILYIVDTRKKGACE
ncbi:nuclear transport factor 2 family protein [Flavitalea sp. BT771]|uniref:nuclear transport factor 2 family protein n=1 Tax=Flavitalea sp. BT771 TaxID=3063329 RepID=UPI0026E1A6E9|nr:nuclear transport factor 2 family protein [Flavitalea sp. BT771]MDO6431450.1 nuclear transport factor 2 family protein [Flavitalea sp. BT771]MDV6220358.1 nuclear transport factor 2 family protein [Flavitalea sp. BT771]